MMMFGNMFGFDGSFGGGNSGLFGWMVQMMQRMWSWMFGWFSL